MKCSLSAERKKHVSTQKIDGNIAGVLTAWGRQEGNFQDTEKTLLREEDSLSAEHRGRDKLGKGKKATEREILTPWRRQKEGQHQDKEGKRLGGGAQRSPSGDRRERDKSGHQKKPTRPGTLTT